MEDPNLVKKSKQLSELRFMETSSDRPTLDGVGFIKIPNQENEWLICLEPLTKEQFGMWERKKSRT